MGLDLTVCPIENSNSTWWLSFTRIRLDCDYYLQGLLGGKMAETPIQTHLVPDFVKFDWYGDEGIERRTDDQYGDSLHYVKPIDLKNIKTDSLSQWNKSVLLMLKNLPEDTPIVLWWH